MAEWQPIETAPKEAISLLLIDGIGDPRVGRWNPNFGYWQDLHSCQPMPAPELWMDIPDWHAAFRGQS